MSHNQDYNILIRCDINPTIERNNILIYRQDILYRVCTSQCHLYTILHLLQGQFSNANNYIISLKSTLLNKSEVASDKAHSSFLPCDQHISAGDVVFETLVDSSILAVYEVYVHIISSIWPTTDSSSSSSGDDKHNSGIQASEEVDIYTRIDSILTYIHDLRLHLIDPDSGSDSNSDGPMPEKGAMILSPKWVRKVSYFTRTFASIVPLLLQSLYYNIIRTSLASPLPVEPIAQASTSGSSSGGGRKASPGLSSSGSDATTTVTSSSSVTTKNLDGSGSSSAVGVLKQSSYSSTSVGAGAGVVYVSLDGVDKHSERYKSACDAVNRLKNALVELLGMLRSHLITLTCVY